MQLRETTSCRPPHNGRKKWGRIFGSRLFTRPRMTYLIFKTLRRRLRSMCRSIVIDERRVATKGGDTPLLHHLRSTLAEASSPCDTRSCVCLRLWSWKFFRPLHHGQPRLHHLSFSRSVCNLYIFASAFSTKLKERFKLRFILFKLNI